MLAIRNLAYWFVNTVTIFRKIKAPTNVKYASIAVFPQTFPLQLVTDQGFNKALQSVCFIIGQGTRSWAIPGTNHTSPSAFLPS
jgi:hypothetical protein